MGVDLLVLAALADCLLFLGVGAACLVFVVALVADLGGFVAPGGLVEVEQATTEAKACFFLLGWKQRRMLV